jgi:hypothetical protein
MYETMVNAFAYTRSTIFLSSLSLSLLLVLRSIYFFELQHIEKGKENKLFRSNQIIVLNFKRRKYFSYLFKYKNDLILLVVCSKPLKKRKACFLFFLSLFCVFYYDDRSKKLNWRCMGEEKMSRKLVSPSSMWSIRNGTEMA